MAVVAPRRETVLKPEPETVQEVESALNKVWGALWATRDWAVKASLESILRQLLDTRLELLKAGEDRQGEQAR